MDRKLSAEDRTRQAARTHDFARRRRRFQGGAAISLLLACGPVTAAAAAAFSPWAGTGHSQARLVALGPAASDAAVREAAVEIRLDPGYLTYWRQPGEAGLPPTFATQGSDNVAAVAVDYPAPGRFDEGGVTLFGYRQAVTFPLRVTLRDPARPATLSVDLDYAVCAAICLPGKAALRLALPDRTDPAAAALLAAARAKVPRPAPLGGPGPLAVMTVMPEVAASKPRLLVAARAMAPASLFVEAPDGWFFETGAPAETGAGALTFPLTLAERPADAGGAVDLRLTLVDATGSITVPARVDVGAAKP